MQTEDPSAAQSSAKRRPAQTPLIAASLVVLVIVAGAKAYRDSCNNMGDEPTLVVVEGATPPPPGPPRLSDYNGAMVRSRIVVGRAGDGAEGRPVVALGDPVQADTAHLNGFQKRGYLVRELVRQALLIAARDELGL